MSNLKADEKKEKIVDICWQVIEQFNKDWQRSPYEWQTEIDIQSDISSRLRQALKDREKLLQKAKYDYIREGKMQNYSRVCCEWSTNYNDAEGERGSIEPDIIIYDDIDDPDHPPDSDLMKNWPMLWVCEIKYQTEDTSAQYIEWDIEKLGYLLKQGETKFACSLFFNRKEIGKELIEPIEEEEGRLRKYTILPIR